MAEAPGDKDERWAEQMLANLARGKARAAERRRAFVAQCDVMAAALWELSTTEWPSWPGTPRAGDTEASAVVISNQSESVADLVQFEVGVHLRSAVDQLRGFASIVDAQSSFIGGVTLARGFFEACVWTVALVDHRLSADVRAQRALTRRLARLSATSRIRSQEELMWDRNATGEPGEESPESAIESILAYADQRHWARGKSRFGDWVGTPLSVDGLIKEMPGDSRTASQYSWTTASSVNHAEHSDDVMAWLNIFADTATRTPPGWLTVANSHGILVGLILVIEEVGRYLGRSILQSELSDFQKTWWSSSG